MIDLISTYRVQLHKNFTLHDLENILPYFNRLGIGTVYTSPVFESVQGSTHGYDGLNPHRIDPEIGTREQLINVSEMLRKLNIKWLQDIVPNHMAFDHRNSWLMDFFIKGRKSRYADFFDMFLNGTDDRLMVPFLGDTLEEVIGKGALQLKLHDGHFFLAYADSAWPVNLLTYSSILQAGDETQPEVLGMFLNQVAAIDEKEDVEWNAVLSQFREIQKHDIVKKYIHHCVAMVNRDPLLIQQVTEQQVYRLCHWKETDSHINYRRFFTVNGLICMNMQDEKVFTEYHKTIHELVEKNIFHGLRVDHIDGLYNPSEYLHRLRNLAGMDVPIYVEKILESGESLPAEWPVQGNTGYDFLSLANNLFTNVESEKKFTAFYRNLTGIKKPVEELVYEKKAYMLENHMKGELDNLYDLFMGMDVIEKKAFASVRSEDVKRAIGSFLVNCPVYRFYGNQFPLDVEETLQVKNVLGSVVKRNPELKKPVEILDKLFLKIPLKGDPVTNSKIAHFYKRCMQFSGPLMAKGVEDTLMYTYHHFIGHNEVGDTPTSFGMSIQEFHNAMTERQLRWPYSLNATSTHDTKRGEDVRARLNVLTEIPGKWFHAVEEWRKLNESSKHDGAPDDNDEYFIYQILAGASPYEGIYADDFPERLKQYFQKALREAKTHSNWAEPNEKYEKAVEQFITRILEPGHPFGKSFTTFLREINDFGIVNSLSQVILKFTCPGIPDVYQGCELWDFSLVDPDNRRPVDYLKRNNILLKLGDHVSRKELWANRNSGEIKLWLVQQLCILRRRNSELFTSGEYMPLKTSGKYSRHVMAFARKFRRQLVVIVVPLHTAIICREQGVPVDQIDWNDTTIEFPETMASGWDDLVSGNRFQLKKSVKASALFAELPFALLKGNTLLNERGAGILMHISSLISPYGIGDLGPEARNFADFLLRSRQKYWQLLPLNPIEQSQGYSPYSSICSRAGNPLFISPDLLIQEGWLDSAEVKKYEQVSNMKADFKTAEKIKAELLNSAWGKFLQEKNSRVKKDFEAFVIKEQEWLDDFSLYIVLKELNGGRPWFEWKDHEKKRDVYALSQIKNEHAEVLEKIKWYQFIFMRQWKELKKYCNDRGICLIGDLPFYVSYDSSDVWAHPQIFALDAEGKRTGVAGVPPDAFSDDGQLWGMPVFRWDVLKKENYSWWIERLRKNKELFDIVRLDHFRAFSAYWKVHADADTAKEGTWEEGPGADFFAKVRKELGELSFVAEDLGEIDEPVYSLRDEFHLPGMKVLQFAFGGGIATSLHIPHNYEKNFLVYTGTHDNNTTRGWFMNDADEEVRLSLERYVGRGISSAEVSMVMARLAYASVANIVILPIQDVLNLDGTARMNRPASVSDNWGWRLLPGQLNEVAEENLKNWTRLYNRE